MALLAGWACSHHGQELLSHVLHVPPHWYAFTLLWLNAWADFLHAASVLHNL